MKRTNSMQTHRFDGEREGILQPPSQLPSKRDKASPPLFPEKRKEQYPVLRSRWFVLMILTIAAFYPAVFHSLSNMPLSTPLLYGVHQRFWMQPLAVATTVCTIGIGELIRALLSNSNLRSSA